MTNHSEQEEDTSLFAELQDRIGGRDPVPAAVVDAAKGAFAWRTIDAELAALVYDSTTDERVLDGVRGGGSAHLLTFEGPELTIDLEVAAERDGRRIVGQLVPPQQGRVEVLHAGGSTSVDADHLGRFAVDGIPSGPFSLCCQPAANARTVQTDWTTI